MIQSALFAEMGRRMLIVETAVRPSLPHKNNFSVGESNSASGENPSAIPQSDTASGKDLPAATQSDIAPCENRSAAPRSDTASGEDLSAVHESDTASCSAHFSVQPYCIALRSDRFSLLKTDVWPS